MYSPLLSSSCSYCQAITSKREQRVVTRSAMSDSFAINLVPKISLPSPDRSGCWRQVWPPMAPSVSSMCATKPRPCFSRRRHRKSGRIRKSTTPVPARSVPKAISLERTAYICAPDRMPFIRCMSFTMATGNRSKSSNLTPGPSRPR